MKRNLIKDQRGIMWVMFVGVTTMIVATTTWLVAMLVTSNFIDIFGAQATGPMTLSLGETVRTQGSILVIIIDAGMIAWMVVSAFIKERQEAPISF